MTEQTKDEAPCGQRGIRDVWYPLRKRFFSSEVRLPTVLEAGDPLWTGVDWLRRSLGAPLFVPSITEWMLGPGRVAVWSVSMDVVHFSPSEVSLRIKDGFLEVEGSHEEKPDEHGFIARRFTRRFRLPVEVDVTKLVSTLSVDGVLTVEAPIPESSVPAPILIPIQIQVESEGAEAGTEEEAEAAVCGDQIPPSGATAGPERAEAGEPTGGSQTLLVSDDKTSESLQTPPEGRVVTDGEVQVQAGGSEGPTEQALGTDPQTELDAADMKQEHTS